MPHTVLSHTADTGIDATAPTFAGLVAELATGMFGLMAAPAEPTRTVETTIDSREPADLVIDSLSELLYLSEVEGLVFVAFDVASTDGGLAITAHGLPSGDIDLVGPPIKAVTYHGLVVEPFAEEWHGRVYFDV